MGKGLHPFTFYEGSAIMLGKSLTCWFWTIPPTTWT